MNALLEAVGGGQFSLSDREPHPPTYLFFDAAHRPVLLSTARDSARKTGFDAVWASLSVMMERDSDRLHSDCNM